MFHLHKSKRYDVIDKFNDTPRFLNDIPILTIDNLEFDKKKTYY